MTDRQPGFQLFCGDGFFSLEVDFPSFPRQQGKVVVREDSRHTTCIQSDKKCGKISCQRDGVIISDLNLYFSIGQHHITESRKEKGISVRITLSTRTFCHGIKFNEMLFRKEPGKILCIILLSPGERVT